MQIQLLLIFCEGQSMDRGIQLVNAEYVNRPDNKQKYDRIGRAVLGIEINRSNRHDLIFTKEKFSPASEFLCYLSIYEYL